MEFGRWWGEPSSNYADIGAFQLKSSEHGAKWAEIRWNWVEFNGILGEPISNYEKKLGDSNWNQAKMGENELKLSKMRWSLVELSGQWWESSSNYAEIDESGQTSPINSMDLRWKTLESKEGRDKMVNKVPPNPKSFQKTNKILFWASFLKKNVFFSVSRFLQSQTAKKIKF